MAEHSGRDKKMWGGRFQGDTSRLVEAFTTSVPFDKALCAQDIAGSRAHARMLAQQGILQPAEAEAICNGLDRIEKEIEQGRFEWRTELEDVHMNIEQRLTDLIGPVGKKLHTGRSRNDQVALDFRLFADDKLQNWCAGLKSLVSVLCDRAEENREVLMPGFTHLQPAQPVSLAHHLMAYAQMFCRDAERLEDCRKRIRVSPLGAAALAGTTYPLNPDAVAHEVGFDAVFSNSMDAVSDRDFVAESLFAGSLIMTHVSRFCEDIILWASPAFGFVTLPDDFATGSSIMPQKKNPDVAELLRGKTGRVYGDLMAVLTMLKGLPMTYNRDLQEDKEPFLDADKTVHTSLLILSDFVRSLLFVPSAMERQLKNGYLNATELADYLVGKGIPFREAHHITGRAVSYAEAQGKGLEELSLEELRTFSNDIAEDVHSALSFRQAVARRETHGGTGPEAIRRQIESMRTWLSEGHAPACSPESGQ